VNANHALALRERAARQREDDHHKEAVAARLIEFAFKPPTTRRDAQQLQRDLDTWGLWVRHGEAPELPVRKRRTRTEIAATKSSMVVKSAAIEKRSKAGPGIERDKHWQAKGVPKRTVAVVAFDFIPITGDIYYDHYSDKYHMAAPEDNEEES
jgi:hypothetical protein